MVFWWNDANTESWKYSEKNPSWSQLVHHNSDIDVTSRGEWPFVNRLNQGRAWKMAMLCCTALYQHLCGVGGGQKIS
jgi:hypothetical protein